ncbi:MAG: hypothetical protein KAS32_17995 [Candidatus Peribacteraceae bacterium]|nr:hypothetical protein [Candidatus Peribacteraceae bacterium]
MLSNQDSNPLDEMKEEHSTIILEMMDLSKVLKDVRAELSNLEDAYTYLYKRKRKLDVDIFVASGKVKKLPSKAPTSGPRKIMTEASVGDLVKGMSDKNRQAFINSLV